MGQGPPWRAHRYGLGFSWSKSKAFLSAGDALPNQEWSLPCLHAHSAPVDAVQCGIRSGGCCILQDGMPRWLPASMFAVTRTGLETLWIVESPALSCFWFLEGVEAGSVLVYAAAESSVQEKGW